MHVSSSYAKLLGDTNFQPREFPRSGSKAKDVKEKERERRERLKVGNNNGQLRIATATTDPPFHSLEEITQDGLFST